MTLLHLLCLLLLLLLSFWWGFLEIWYLGTLHVVFILLLLWLDFSCHALNSMMFLHLTVIDQHFLMFSLGFLTCQHFQEFLGIWELFFWVLFDGSPHFFMIKPNISLPNAIEQTGERVGEMMTFRPYFFKIILKILQFLGLQLIQNFLLLLLLILIKWDLLLKWIFGIFDQDSFFITKHVQ